MRPLKIFFPLAIIAFWAVMTGWLVRANWDEGNAPFSDMPPMVVLRQLLKHEVASNLGIYRGQKRIGTVTITPLHNPANAISLDGNIAIAPGGGEGAKAQVYNFSLRLDLEPRQLQPETINLRLSRRQPAFNALIAVLLKDKKIRYQIKDGDFDLGAQEMPLSSSGMLGMVPGLAGLPPLPMEPATLLKSLEIQANRANFSVRGETMDGYRLKMGAAGVSGSALMGQLGEIFVLRTSTEYFLLADGLDPQKYLP